MINFWRRFIPLLLLGLSLFLTGTLGYILIEGWTVVEAFYMTVITLTTVGFAEVRPLSTTGRLFTSILVLFGVGGVAYGFSTIVELLFTASVGGELRRRRMKRKIERLRDHVIVCGYGRVGYSTVESLHENKRDVVVIERDPAKIEELVDQDMILVEGDAAKDHVLQAAGVERAWGLIVCTGSDSLNLFVVLSARALNPDLFIIARSIDAENESKMKLAGANRVVSPYRIGGRHMANIVVRPHVTDFFDVVTLDGGIEIWVEELVIAADSPLVGQTVGAADVRRSTGVQLVAVLRHGGGSTLMPDAATQLNMGDELIVLGTRQQLAALEALTGGEAGH